MELSLGFLKRIGPLRQIVIDGNVAIIPLTRGLFAMIDAADVPLVEGRLWQATPDRFGKVYAARTDCVGGKKKTVKLHRLLLAADGDVDHINGNSLDNRRSNLRVATRGENCANRKITARNTSGFKGVSRHRDKWRAAIRAKGTYKHLGYFNSPSAAHAAYVEAAQTLFGEFARTH